MATKEFSELQYLEQYYQKEGSQLVVFYGQKNMDMTGLLRRFCEGKSWAGYCARPCSEREQLYEWGRELTREGLALSEYPDYEELFQAIIRNRCEKKVIVVREFQHLVKTGGNFMAQLASFTHNQWTNQPILVLLCSSSIGWVENSMVQKIGEAAYEISGFVKMKELGFRELSEAFPGYDRESQIGVYSILGGFPELWAYFDREKTLVENICSHVLNSRGVLHEEALRLVSEELRETGVYHAILAALAAGRQKLNDLYLHTGFSRAKISVYLKNMMELELVEKVFSFDTAGRENTQKGIYRIRNPFVHFYFRYVYPNLSLLDRMDAKSFYRTCIEADFANYVAPFYRQICMQYMQVINQEGKLPFVYEQSGEWVGKAGDIDLIARDDAHTLIGLCSWQKPMAFADYEWLLFCARKARLKADYVYLFSRVMPEAPLLKKVEESEHIVLITLDMM